MRSTLVRTALMAGVLGTLVGCSGSKTPEQVFADFKDAADKKDYKRMVSHLTNESQDMMAGGLVFVGSFAAGMGEMPGGSAEAKESSKKIADVLKKHGVGEDALKTKPKVEKQDPEAAMKELAALVKDKPGFIADMLAALPQKGGEGFDVTFKDLKNLKVEGDTATGTVTQVSNGKDKESPIKFVKKGGVWKIDMVGMMKDGKKA
jgi:hypothetical protein